MLSKENISSVANLHTALRNQSIRSKRDASDKEKSAVALLAYFKALPSASDSVATLDQLKKACATLGMIDKELDKLTIVSNFRVAQGLTVKTANGIAKSQIRLLAYAHTLPTTDAVKLHETIAKNQTAFETVVTTFVNECIDKMKA